VWETVSTPPFESTHIRKKLDRCEYGKERAKTKERPEKAVCKSHVGVRGGGGKSGGGSKPQGQLKTKKKDCTKGKLNRLEEESFWRDQGRCAG